jgi:predicted transcriptional regulator
MADHGKQAGIPVARLGELERAVMEALWDLTVPSDPSGGPAAAMGTARGGSGRGTVPPEPPDPSGGPETGTATARQVAERLAAERSLAYTTVLTVLARLERKGMVRHLREGRTHPYAPVASREDYAAELMLEALGAAGDRSRGAVLARFGDAVASLPEAAALRQALQESPADPVRPAREEGAG